MTIRAKTSLKWELVGGAVRRYPDGREVCCDNAKGKREYKRRIEEMVRRQGFRCGLNSSHQIYNPTFEHADLRGAGGATRDDRIVDENGKPMNCAACFICNGLKGSRR